jgi:hypothetical protein
MAKATETGGKGNRTFTKGDVQKDTARRIIKGAFTKKNLKASAVDVAMMMPIGRGVKAAELAGKVAPAALKFAERTGARIIADRKGAQIAAEKAARITPKTSDKVARAVGREAAGTKAKGPGGRPQLTKNNKTLRRATKSEKVVVAERTGNKPGQFKNVEKLGKKKGAAPERIATTVEKESRAGKMTVRYESPKKLKAAAEARKTAGKERMTDIEPARRKAPVVRSKVPRRARDVNNLGVGTDARLAKKTTAREQAKATARANRGNRPALIAKTKAAVRRTAEKQKAAERRQKAETRIFNDKTPVKQYDSSGRVIGSTTKGELRQLKVKTQRAAADPRNSLRGEKQGTIDSRSPRRPSEPTDKEVEILRKVGKRDYSRGEVNPLAQKTVQQEADSLVGQALRDPRIRVEDTAREKAAAARAKADTRISRAIKQAPKKTFRGKAK